MQSICSPAHGITMRINRPDIESKAMVVRGVRMHVAVPTDILRYLAEEFPSTETETLDWIDGFEVGSVFYDVGASVGLFTMYAALLRPLSVVAFEPEAQSFAGLETNHFLNRAALTGSVTCLNVALGAEPGVHPLHVQRYGAGWAMKVMDKPVRRLESDPFEPEHTQMVLQDTLDAIIARYRLPAPHYLKIDVDGPELKVLQGASESLGGVRSALVEVVDDNRGLVVETMKASGLALAGTARVEDFDGLYNCIFVRENP